MTLPLHPRRRSWRVPAGRAADRYCRSSLPADPTDRTKGCPRAHRRRGGRRRAIRPAPAGRPRAACAAPSAPSACARVRVSTFSQSTFSHSLLITQAQIRRVGQAERTHQNEVDPSLHSLIHSTAMRSDQWVSNVFCPPEGVSSIASSGSTTFAGSNATCGFSKRTWHFTPAGMA